MPFPTIGNVLDNFNRANSATLGTNWSEPWRSTDTSSDWQIDLNQAKPNFNGVANSIYYNANTYGPDIEVYVDVSTLGNNFSLAARISEGGTSTTDGYTSHYINTGLASDNLIIYRVDNGVGTQLGATASFPQIDAGACLGLEIIGTTLTNYYNIPGGSWSAAASRTDATYGNVGNFGLYSQNDTTMHIDDFSGGTIGGGMGPQFGFAKRRTDWAGFRM